MPPRPYLPTDTLRNAICYPFDGDAFNQAELEACFKLAGVQALISHLDQSNDWDKALLREQQQRLGLVRLLLQKPKWIFMQEAFDSLDPDGEIEMINIINSQLPHAAMLTITNQPTIQALHKRQIHLC
jgi:putative ATP-binding cassette transporter